MKAGQKAAAQQAAERLRAEGHSVQEGPYRVEGSGTYWLKRTGESPEELKLSNFSAEIVEDRLLDDGEGGYERHFTIHGQRGGRPLQTVVIPAQVFGAMNWPTEKWGARVQIEVGYSSKDRLRDAILKRSNAEERVVYAHTGWRKEDGNWVYIDAGGGIGRAGRVEDVTTDLARQVKRYVLMPPTEEDDLQSDFELSLGFLDLAPDRVTVPMFSLVWRALVGQAPMTVFVAGVTGALKSTLCVTLLGHLGSFDRTDLFRFRDTAAALTDAAFSLKDSLMLVDDYKPGDPRDDRTARDFLQGQGDGGGRNRATVTGRMRNSRPPRCTVLATGEDLPAGGASTVGRCFLLRLEKGDVNKARLDELERRQGTKAYARVGFAFVSWLAGNLDEIRAWMKTELPRFRREYDRPGMHSRTPEQAAELRLGAELFVRFAAENSLLSAEEARRLELRFRAGIEGALDQHDGLAEAEDPICLLRRMTCDLIASGKVHLRTVSGAGAGPSFGWAAESAFKPSAPFLGWVAADRLFLLPTIWRSEVQKCCRDQGTYFGLSQVETGKRLAKLGAIVEKEDRHNTCRKWAAMGPDEPPRRRTVVAISRDWLFGEWDDAESAESAEPDPVHAEDGCRDGAADAALEDLGMGVNAERSAAAGEPAGCGHQVKQELIEATLAAQTAQTALHDEGYVAIPRGNP